MFARKRPQRKAAVKANQKLVEAGARKKELSRLQALVTGASHTFGQAQSAFLDSFEEEPQSAEIGEVKQRFESAFEGYSQRIAELIVYCVETGNTVVQETSVTRVQRNSVDLSRR